MSAPPSDAKHVSKDPIATGTSGLSIGAKLLILFAVYFGLHVLTRSFVSNNLQLDEAEQLIVTQDWRWGYGSQPPLYNWIQNALFHLLGVNVFALSLLKNVSLWATYAITFLAAREILANARHAALATAALLFFPQIAWESQRDQSHLVLATTIAAATLWIYVRLLKTEKLVWYVLFGVAIAFGCLAKYNYLLLPVSLLFASFLNSQFRRAILNWKLLVTLIALLAVAAPHLIWIVENKTAVSSQSYKLMSTGLIAPKSPFAGVLQVFKAFMAVTIAPALIFSPWLIRTLKSRFSEMPPLLSLLWKAFAVAFVALLVAVVVSQITYLRDRWVQPLMFALPIFLVGVINGALHERHVRRLFVLAGVVAITVLTAINITVIGANALGRSHNLNIPYPALAAELRKTGFTHGTIVANGFLLGGNLKNQFRDARVIVPELEESVPAQRPALVIWSARSDELPEEFLNYASRVTSAQSELTPSYLEIPCRNGKRTSEKFGFVLLP